MEDSKDLISTAQIAVTQLPVIEERLQDVKAAVAATVADAKSLVATADTVQAVKAKRAELNKQFDALESQRKEIKKQILGPYERFEAIYRDCIAVPFKEADAALKATTDAFEGELKSTALQKVEAYYNELCEFEFIDFLPFEEAAKKCGLKISLADCKTKEPNKAKDLIANFVSGIAIGMDDVRKMDDAAEIMVEFKKCLNAGQAAAIVAERKRSILAAKEAAEQRKHAETQKEEMTIRPALAPAENPDRAKFPPQISFTIKFKTEEEYRTVRPILLQLRETLKKGGIEYA